MGSFYSTCSISNMTLSSQKTSILLLVPSYSKTFKEHMGMIVSNDGCQCFFSPFGFPIHGEYSDYGYIDNVVRDKNVEMLEAFFNLDIDTILNTIGDDRVNHGNKVKNKDILKKLGKTYFRTEVLEYLEQGYQGLDVKNPQQYTPESRMSGLLKILSEDKTKAKDKLSLLAKKGKHSKLSDKDIEEIVEASMSINEYTIKEKTYIPTLTDINMFCKLPITTKDFKTEILKQYQFLRAFGFDLNRILLPSNYGSQDNNSAKLYKLNQFVNELLYTDMKLVIDEQKEDYVTEEEFIADNDYYTEELEIVKKHKI